MKTLRRKLFFIVVISAISMMSRVVCAQTNYTLFQKESSLVIHGTSTIHDWEMPAHKFIGEIAVELDERNGIQIERVALSVVAESILSDNKIMDKKTHDALKTNKNPAITFDFSGIQQLKENGSQFTGEAEGKLTIAGSSRLVKIPFKGINIDNKKIEVKGVVGLKMTDFAITPPTAMLGTLKTGDEIKIDYRFIFLRDPDLKTSMETGL